MIYTRRLTSVAFFVFSSMAFSLSAGPTENTPKPIEILRIEPTVLFSHGKPLMQLARLTVVNNAGRAIKARARISLKGRKPHDERLGPLAPGETTCEIHVPDIDVATKLRVEILTAAGQDLAVHETVWQPQRHWVVYIIKSTHHDLGYEDYEHIKRRQVAQYIDDARGITDTTWKLPDANRYHWTIEHLHWLRGCLNERSWPWFRELVDQYIKTGKMALVGAHSGVHSHWHSPEQLFRSTYWGRRHARDRLGLDLPLYLVSDVPGIAWPLAQAWARAGGRYVINCQNLGWRFSHKPKDSFQHTRVPLIFWWVGPDGRSKVLFSNPGPYWLWFNAGCGITLRSGHGDMLERIPRFLRSVEKGAYGPYPYDLFLAPAYQDHEPPLKVEADAVAQWNKHWCYPELRIDAPVRFMAEMEKRHGARIPTLAGDVNNSWADYAAIDSDTVGLKRAAGHRLAVAEGLASVSRMLDPHYRFAQRRIDDAYWRLCEFDEHCWPTLLPPDDVQETNVALVKHHNVRIATEVAGDELRRALDTIASKVSCTTVPAVVVFNPLAHPRTDLASVPLAKLGADADQLTLVDNVTGKAVACQRAGEQLVFLARDVPPFGYRTYTVGRGTTPPVSDVLKADGTTLENRFYRIAFDGATGTIVSLFDKELGRELVDKSAPHGFNQFIYDHRLKRSSTDGYQASPTKAKLIAGQTGPVFATMRVETVEPRSGAEIRQMVTLYRDLKRVEITNELSNVRAMWEDERKLGRKSGQTVSPSRFRKITSRYKDNVFIAFPLHVPDATIRAEYSVGTVRPYDDQLRLGSHDYLLVQQYVDCSNEDYGVTWTTCEAPVVHFGGIRYNQFSNDYKPQQPWLYSYVMSNRMAGLIWHHPDQCRAELHYTLTSHAGSWPEGGVTGYGWQRGNPLVTTVLERPQEGTLPPRQLFVDVDAPNVQMVVLKPSEPPGRGFVIRLVETDARPKTVVHIRFPMFQFARAVVCDLVENDVKALPLDDDGQGFRITMGRHAVSTVRLVPTGQVPGKVTSLRADAVSDKAIRLTWPAVQDATGYCVYRLPGAGEPTCLDNLIAETHRTQYVDDWLNLDTIYRYRVVAVSPGNLDGEPSDEVAACTSSENISPPSPVRELTAIERGPRRVILTWRSGKESDVAGYEVYRSEQPDFKPDQAHRIHVVDKPGPYYRQLYIDTNVQPGKSYSYRVLAVDSEKRHSPSSPVSTVILCDDPPPLDTEPHKLTP